MRALIVLAALGLSACATAVPMDDAGDRLAELERSCRARDGVLTPSAGPMSGRPETDNVCRISGGASRLPRG